VGGKAIDGKWSGHAYFFIVFVGFVVEVFGFGFGGNGSVDLFLPGDAKLPPFGV
jgi:hypothetical protein